MRVRRVQPFLVGMLLILSESCAPAGQADAIAPSSSSPTAAANQLDPASEMTELGPSPAVAGESISATAESTLEPAPTVAFDPSGMKADVGTGFVALVDPEMVPAAQATWLKPEQIVLGAEQNGEAQAFPIAQLAYHHIANVTIGGQPFLVTY